jgi:hypothetical protein
VRAAVEAVAVTTTSRDFRRELALDRHGVEDDRMGERNDLGGLLGGEDAGQARDREGVALGQLACAKGAEEPRR